MEQNRNRAGYDRIVILLSTLLLISASASWVKAKSIPRVKIRGRIIDAASKTPLHFVNVFLDNTSLGAATYEEGYYTIDFVPVGRYRLIVRMMGYESQSREIVLKEEEGPVQNFQLIPIAIEAPTLQVRASVPRQWKRNLKRFQEEFLGKSENALSCRILNPEYLEFEVNDAGALTAAASELLIIENRALGYRIHYHLRQFRLRENGMIEYEGEKQYESLTPKNERVARNWEENRRQTYLGSMRHFFTALFHQELQKEGFIIFKVYNLNRSDESENLKSTFTGRIVQPSETWYQKKLLFDHYLRIYYTGERMGHDTNFEISRKSVTGGRMGEGYQTSWIKMNRSTPVRFNAQGHFLERYALIEYGHWAELRVGDELPLNYEP